MRAIVLVILTMQLTQILPFKRGYAETLPVLAVPPENLIQNTLPPMDDAVVLAEKILTVLQKKDVTLAKGLFFPEAEFLSLKDIKDPGRYYKELVTSFERDLQKISAKLSDAGELTFSEFKRGSCKWKEIGSQYNTIAYWSCYRSKFFATGAKGKIEIELHTLINWGNKWYVTHLGQTTKTVPDPPVKKKN